MHVKFIDHSRVKSKKRTDKLIKIGSSPDVQLAGCQESNAKQMRGIIHENRHEDAG